MTTRTPAPVNPSTDPELPQPGAPRPRPTATTTTVNTAADPGLTQTPAAAPVRPEFEQPVQEVTTANLISTVEVTPAYAAVQYNGVQIVDQTAVFDFVGNGVSVTGSSSGSRATITISNSGSGTAGLPLANGTSNFDIATASGAATITAGTRTWTFDTNGALDVPAYGVYEQYGRVRGQGLQLRGDTNEGGSYTYVILPPNATAGSQATSVVNEVGNVLLYSNAQSWTFDTAGNLVYPDGAVTVGGATYAAPDSSVQMISNNAHNQVRVDDANVEIYTSLNGIVSQQWLFDGTGNLTLPSNTASINYANGTPYGGSGGGANLGNLTVSNVTIGTASANNPIVIETVQDLPQWYNLYGDLGTDITDDYGEGIAYDSEGNVYLVGSDGALGINSFLAKFSPTGTLLWQKAFDLDGHYKSGESVTTDSAGNVYATFVDYDDNSDTSYLVKLDTDGVLLWQKKLETNGVSMGNMIVDHDDNLCLVLKTQNQVVFKFSPSGAVLWQQEIVGASGYGIAVDGDNNIIVGEYPVTKMDSSGTVIWQVLADASINLDCDPDGNIYCLDGVAQIMKIDPTGAAVWRKNINISNLRGIAYDLSTNSVVVTGGQAGDLLIASLDAVTGDLNWCNAFGGAGYEGQWYFYGTDFVQTRNNLLVTTGYTYTPDLPNAEAVVVQVLTSGIGQGTYGDYSYYAVSTTVSDVPFVTTLATFTVQPGTIVVTTGTLAVSDNSNSSVLVTMAPGGPRAWQFSPAGNGQLVFPDNSMQETALVTGMDWTFGNVTTNQLLLTGNTVSIGLDAGKTSQSSQAVSVGYQAGQISQGVGSIAIGAESANANQGISSVAIGNLAARVNQGNVSVAVGHRAGETYQGVGSIAIGSQAAYSSQGFDSVAIGTRAGLGAQGNASVALGYEAGYASQGFGAIAIGASSGLAQGNESVAVGPGAANSQGIQSIAIGKQAGRLNQGDNAVAVGTYAGYNNQANNSIVLNATGNNLNNTTANTFVAKPIRTVNDVTGFYQLYWNPTTGEIVNYQP